MTSVLKKTPNAEQEKAIFHNGGKLLSAGAGSGKTFVLIEHLVFLLGNIQKSSPPTDWNKRISSELSKIVLMTFTKKAAGEMSVRMMRRVEEIVSEAVLGANDSDFIFWGHVRQNLSFLNITTIHGFCHRLLRLGYWSDFPSEINLVSSIEHKDKIQKLFDKWFKEKRDGLDPLFLASSQALFSAMVEIFSSPELRVLWGNPKIPQSAEVEIDQFFSQLLTVKGYGSLFKEGIDLSVDSKEEKKKWYELLVQFNEVLTVHGEIKASNYLVYSDFFKTISRFPTTNSKEISFAQRESLGHIRELRDDLKDLVEDLKAVTRDFDSYKKWVHTIAELFQFIDSHYFEVDGFSFSDLEYYVLCALKKPEVLEKVQESYSYFIVDEFQDTSFIQFEILKNLIGSRPEKIFCVGDRKQAIYGFRGGELQVFSDCANFLGETNNYFLKNNFRSYSSIIQYNNELFERVFPLGLKFEGLDPHSVQMEAQVIPSMNSNPGEVLALRTEIKVESDDYDLDQLEAKVLSEHVSELLKKDEFQSICVLYRKLKPSSLLLEHFLLNDISFSAQIKIQFADDPLINIFLYLIELYLNQADQKKMDSAYLLLQTLLSVLSVKSFRPLMMKQFFLDLKLFGLRLAFHKFIFSIGLSNSFHAQNAEVIDAICRLTREDVVKVYHLLKNDEGEEYACEMMSGAAGVEGKKRIIIMSAHASKGLEFDAVLLGGIHTNGRYNGMKDHVGKFPHSFKWKKAFDKKKFFKSPFYHLESEILKLKDFSESKRLLYVACTRAVKHLAFVDLWSVVKDSPKDLHLYDNSWIQALRLIAIKQQEKTIENSDRKRVEVALIQQDPLGMLAQESGPSLGVISELSVTRLATIADCPFKFYLQNICKIDSVEVEAPFSMMEEEMEEEIFYSSKKRGTEVHGYLSKLFLKEISEERIPLKEKDKIMWAHHLASDYHQKFEVISERMIKFSFFGQMISGTPDLVFLNSERLVVWDFKTGIRDEESEASYWFQLMSYAYAYGKLKQFNPDSMVELSLLYLDQKEIISKELSVNEITQALFSHWKKTEALDQVNTHHCGQCEYTSICQKGKTSTPS
ncbi:MAG: UvrD-helicase domain-containing protein [Bacteriovorax sp.]